MIALNWLIGTTLKCINKQLKVYCLTGDMFAFKIFDQRQNAWNTMDLLGLHMPLVRILSKSLNNFVLKILILI